MKQTFTTKTGQVIELDVTTYDKDARLWDEVPNGAIVKDLGTVDRVKLGAIMPARGKAGDAVRANYDKVAALVRIVKGDRTIEKAITPHLRWSTRMVNLLSGSTIQLEKAVASAIKADLSTMKDAVCQAIDVNVAGKQKRQSSKVSYKVQLS